MVDMSTEDEITAVLDEVRLLSHRAVLIAERLHATEPVTAAGRAVLELLHRSGPASVSAIARQRDVTRQHIQALVQTLLRQGLVGAHENPAHRRSPLIALTPTGARLVRRMTRREQRYLARIPLPVADRDLTRAREILAALRAAIDSTH
jgi:DNA-binding MarR family transcriptional regulator